jgi:hypothetical protein
VAELCNVAVVRLRQFCTVRFLQINTIIMTSNNIKSEEFKISGNWIKTAKAIQDKYALLSDADLKFEAGKEDELLGRIETKLKIERDEAIKIIKKCKVA